MDRRILEEAKCKDFDLLEVEGTRCVIPPGLQGCIYKLTCKA